MNDKKARASLWLTENDHMRLKVIADILVLSIGDCAEQLMVEALDRIEEGNPHIAQIIAIRKNMIERSKGDANEGV